MAGDNGMYGYAGKILRINLSDGQVWTEPTSKYAREWVGQAGFAIKILYDELKSWVTPYEPANRLIIGAGPLIGTMAPGSNKMNVSSLGPTTGGWASSCSDSYVGGQIKCAGYDSIVIQGKAHLPVYLWIYDDTVEIRNATHLWGKTTWETLETLRNESGDPELHIMSIGPAGENLVRGACIIQDTARAFGRCGQGCVMGSKNLKAIAVKGTGSVTVAKPTEFMECARKCRVMCEKSNIAQVWHDYGTLSVLPRKQEVCGINYKNFQGCQIPDEMVDVIDPRKTIDNYKISQVSFPGCAVGGCGKRLHFTDGPYVGLSAETNQWETLSTIQTRLAIFEPTFLLKVNSLCDQLGIDVDAAGAPVGWAMECWQRGIIDETDTDGLKLEWGDAGVALEMIRRIVYREGFGNILAEGCIRASEIIGRDSSYYALHVKGQDLYENLRGAMGWALGACTSTRGGGHTTGAILCETVPGLNVEKAKTIYGVDNPEKAQDYRGKPEMIYYMEVLSRMCNSLGICLYNTTYLDVDMINLSELAELYSLATGWETAVEDFRKLAMKQLNLEKAFNLRHTSFDRKDDLPPPRDLQEPIPTGDLAGWGIEEAKWNEMLDVYYDLHGWDRATSYPKKQTLIDLGLEDVVGDLEQIGKLG